MTEPKVDAGLGNREISGVLLFAGVKGSIDDIDTVLTCLSILEPRQASVLVMRYGLDGGRPKRQAEVGAQLGVSSSQVSRIERNAIDHRGDTVAGQLLSDVMARMESV